METERRDNGGLNKPKGKRSIFCFGISDSTLVCYFKGVFIRESLSQVSYNSRTINAIKEPMNVGMYKELIFQMFFYSLDMPAFCQMSIVRRSIPSRFYLLFNFMATPNGVVVWNVYPATRFNFKFVQPSPEQVETFCEDS
jgi:hypothetical protein